MKIEFTRAELECLRLMAGNFAYFDDIMKEQFPNAKRRATAYAAFNKLFPKERRRSSTTKDR